MLPSVRQHTSGCTGEARLIHLTYGKCEIADMDKLAAFADMEDQTKFYQLPQAIDIGNRKR